MIEIEPVLVAILSGVGYSLYWYLNKVLDPTKPDTWETLDPYPLFATGLTGAIVGGYMALTGGELTQVSIEVQLMSYVAITAIIEKTVKTLWNWIQVRWG
jgi:hypothetical protein